MFYLELLSLGAELTNAIKAGLKNAAGDVLQHQDDFIKHLDEVEVDAPNGKRRKLTEEEKAKLIDELEEVSGRRFEKSTKFKSFINKWTGKQIKEIPLNVIIKNLRGHTPAANRIADAIEKRGIKVKIIDDSEFNRILIEDDGMTLKEAKATDAWNYNNVMTFRASRTVDNFMLDIVHEGTHALDELKVIELMSKYNYDYIDACYVLGDNWAWEKRAYFAERAFELSAFGKANPEVITIDELIVDVEEFYISEH